MQYPRRYSVTVTTAADGTATAYLEPGTGEIVLIGYTKDDYADTVDFTITTELSLQNVWVESNVTASAVRCPRQPTHDPDDGTGRLYAAAGLPVGAPVYAAEERIKIVLAAGGSAKTGTFTVIVV